MIFTRIIYSAVLLGMAAGLLLSLMQVLTVDPIIFEAETFEISEAESAMVPEGHENHDHNHESWGPADGTERTVYTILSNMSAGIGFAAILLAMMSQFWLPKQRIISPLQSLLWGVAGFATLYLAPGIGLPPEIPGLQAAPVEQRQIWWVLTASCVGIGLSLLAWARAKQKLTGLIFLATPYLIGAPSHEGPEFIHPDPAAVEALIALHQRFIVTSGIVNLLFWIALGLACGFVFNRWFKPLALSNDPAA